MQELIFEKKDERFSLKLYKSELTNEKIDVFHKSLLSDIVILDDKYKQYGKANNITNLRDLKKEYRGQTYIYYPIKISEDLVCTYSSEDECCGYLMISKRDLKSKHPYFRLKNKYEVKDFADFIAEDELEKFNLLLRGSVYNCLLSVDNRIYAFDNLLSEKYEHVVSDVMNNLDFIDVELDKFLINQ